MNPDIPTSTIPSFPRSRLAQQTGIFLFASDFVTLCTSAVLANALHYWLVIRPMGGSFDQIWAGAWGEARVGVFSALIASALAWFSQSGHYTKRRPFWDEIAEASKILTVLAAADAIALYLLKLPFSRFWFVATWGIAIPLLPISRAATKDLLIAKGLWQTPALIIGTGTSAIKTAKALRSEPMMGLEPVALVAPALQHKSAPDTALDPPLPILSVAELASIQPGQARNIPIFVALEDYEKATDHALIRETRSLFRDIRIVPQTTGFPLYGAKVHHLFRQELFFLTLHNNLGNRSARFIKRGFDILSSSLLMIILSPLFIYLIYRVKQDGGAAFFAHQRIGANGKPFPCYKFRTMATDAAAKFSELLRENEEARREWEQNFKLKNDPRVTKVGHFLRKTSLDELPQLWNVLTGTMSLVGPRPIVEAELERYGDDSYYYLEARPGITGVWQVSGRNDTDYDYRVYLDTWYAKNWSLWYDIVILIKTIRVVINRAGAY